MSWGNPFFQIALTVVATLACKFVWDRWISQESRVTKEICLKNQDACRSKIMASISIQGNKLDEGDTCFEDIEKRQEKMDRKIMVILLTLLKMCDHAGINCDDLTKEMVNKEILQ